MSPIVPEPLIGPALAMAPKKLRDRAPGKAKRFRALAVRYAILADYVLGEKVEAIAHAHGVTGRMVNYYAAAEGLQRAQGRPRQSGAVA